MIPTLLVLLNLSNTKNINAFLEIVESYVDSTHGFDFHRTFQILVILDLV